MWKRENYEKQNKFVVLWSIIEKEEKYKRKSVTFFKNKNIFN